MSSDYQPGCSDPGDSDPIDPLDPDHVFTCWCGAKGTWDELFSDDIDDTCGGTGSVQCYCGGDICCCHWHGEAPCDGCEDCDPDDFDDDDWDDDDFEDDEDAHPGDDGYPPPVIGGESG